MQSSTIFDYIYIVSFAYQLDYKHESWQYDTFFVLSSWNYAPHKCKCGTLKQRHLEIIKTLMFYGVQMMKNNTIVSRSDAISHFFYVFSRWIKLSNAKILTIHNKVYWINWLTLHESRATK